MSRKRPKTAKARTIPDARKQARAAPEPQSVQGKNPAWHLGTLDLNGPWCPTKLHPQRIARITQRLSGFESMTWGEINRSGSYPVETSILCPAAQRRLEEIDMDEVEELFSLRISGRERVWGIRVGAVLRLLWWDPEHEVCPSNLKYT